MITGRVYDHIYSIEHHSNKISIRSNRWYILLTLVLILVRFFVGKPLLEGVHVVWAYDAIYLFFIGLYATELKTKIRQIDNLVHSS